MKGLDSLGYHGWKHCLRYNVKVDTQLHEDFLPTKFRTIVPYLLKRGASEPYTAITNIFCINNVPGQLDTVTGFVQPTHAHPRSSTKIHTAYSVDNSQL
jgi:hypothetical protein